MKLETITPQLRFPQFANEAAWETRKLGGSCKIRTGKLDANAAILDGKYRFYTCAKDFLLIDNYAFNTEALLISGNGAGVGYVHYYKGKFNAYQRTYVLDEFKEAINFVQFQLETKLRRRIQLESKAGNIPYIVMGTLAGMLLSLPTLPEQRRIADFLTAVDGRIGQLIQKKALLVDYKKGVMQQLFTQAIRFKDDHGNDFPDWEEKKLGELCITITKGTTPTSIGYAYQYTGVNFIKTENINKTGFIDIDSTPKISDDCHRDLDRSSLNEGDVLFSIAGTLGRTAIVQSKDLPANTNQALGIIRLKNKAQNVFITHCLNTAKMEGWVRKMVSVGAQPNLSLTQLNSILIPFPRSTEQAKIADFLSSIDRKIESVSTHITETQTFKRGLLQQMFV